MPRTSVRAYALLIAFGALTTIPQSSDPAAALCSQDIQFESAPTRHIVAPGEIVTVTGVGFSTRCDDGGNLRVGCGAPPANEPRTNVGLRFRQGTETLLASADARSDDDDFGNISWTITIPGDASDGPAKLVADGAGGIAIRVVRD